MPDALYLDSSAIVKTIVEEPESRALRRFLRRRATHVASALARVEVARAIGRVESSALPRARDALEKLVIVELATPLLETAGRLAPLSLRSLDAIHVASALTIASQLEAFVTYDMRLADAAAAAGLRVVSPG